MTLAASLKRCPDTNPVRPVGQIIIFRFKYKSLNPKARLRMQKLVKKELLSFDWLDHYELAHGPTVLELDAPADLGEKSVIFAAPNVQAGLHPRATLAHDDGAS